MSVSIDIQYLGGLKTRAVHGPSGTELRTAAPVDNEGDGSSFSPTDLAATALGTCMITVMEIVARRRSISLEGARLHVEKIMSDDAPRRIAELKIRMRLPDGIPGDCRERLETAARQCPVCHSMADALSCDVEFDWGGL